MEPFAAPQPVEHLLAAIRAGPQFLQVQVLHFMELPTQEMVTEVEFGLPVATDMFVIPTMARTIIRATLPVLPELLSEELRSHQMIMVLPMEVTIRFVFITMVHGRQLIPLREMV